VKVLLCSLPAYMTATGWAALIGGLTGLLVSIAVLAPFTIVGVVVLEGQREKYRHEDRWVVVSQPMRSIDR
jgi:hypothetical protein